MAFLVEAPVPSLLFTNKDLKILKVILKFMGVIWVRFRENVSSQGITFGGGA